MTENANELFEEAKQLWKDGDEMNSIKLFERAGKLNHSESIFYLAIIYHSKKEYDKAFHFMTKAAELEHVDAMNNLGYFYEKGLGCDKDLQMAKEWYEKSHLRGNEFGRANLERIKFVESNKI